MRCQISAGMLARSAIAKTLVERVEDPRALGSLMREVDAAVACGDLGQLDDLVGRRKAIGHVLERRAEAERALLHGLRDDLPHLVELSRCRTAIVLADDVVAHTARADERRDVDRRTRSLVETFEVVAERTPILRDAEVRVRWLRVL